MSTPSTPGPLASPADPPPHTHTDNAVAIIGIAGRFPGAADPAHLWEHLAAGHDLITRNTTTTTPARGTSHTVTAAGTLTDIAGFDAEYFNIPAREADRLDPQQRLLLECASEALADAGCVPARHQGRIAVFAGVGPLEYHRPGHSPDDSGAAGHQARILATDKDFAATRIAHRLDLHGPAVTVQSACSTSLVAVHLAVQSLLTGDSDAALAGAASIRLTHHYEYLYQSGGILAPDGHCRPFHTDAHGTVPASGAGMVLLKRLSDALAAGDHIYALIRGSAVNNDGRTKQSFSAPSATGQEEVITAAHRRARTDPATIGYLEAHGTATPLGDQVEFAALTRAFRTAPRGSCALGSVKANTGHLDAAAGITGLIKAALALHHRRIPPAHNSHPPHPDLHLDTSPFRLPTTAEPWPDPGLGHPRRAAVSSFGIGGTNAHVVLEEAPPAPPPADHPGPHLLLLSARTATALHTAAAQLADHLPAHALTDIATTLTTGRPHLPHRWSTLATDTEAARSALRRFAASTTASVEPPASRRVALVLPDGACLTAQPLHELARDVAKFAALLRELHDTETADLTALLPDAAPGEEHRRLTPAAAVAAHLALARLLAHWGLAPARVSGRGSGALAAACLAGILTPGQALRLAAVREHTPRSAAADSVRHFLAHSRPRPPLLPCRSDVTGTDLTAEQAGEPEYWVRQLCTDAHPAAGDHAWLLPRHDGPRLLLGPAASPGLHPAAGPLLPCLGTGNMLGNLLNAIGRAWQAGADISPDTLAPKPRRQVPLPHHPYRRQRHWDDAHAPAEPAPAPRTPATRTRHHAPEPVPAPKPPADSTAPLIQQITTLWAHGLGLTDIGADDDFTDLGGDSFLALELADALSDTLKVALAAEAVLQARTPRRLAHLVLDAAPDPAPPTSLTLLTPAGGPPAAGPLFLVHPVGGSALVYRDLAAALAPGTALHGFTARGLPGPGGNPITDLHAMASTYAAELLHAHPGGPFWIGGSSFGGVVAHEMTRILTDTHHRPPEATFLLDSPWPAHLTAADTNPAAQAGQVRDLPDTIRAQVLAARLAHLAALTTYTPPRHHGPTLYIRAEDRPHGGAAPEDGWRTVLPHLVIQTSPGDHESMLAAPHAHQLALLLSRHLRTGSTSGDPA
ncbi:beta-ketoacyl synthase N-terminal-like domain-containing protein [Kitasatospora purpeofusca]|uniref:beta-ketoacyl synthase N-terminal-like domain-containing protein n=1 Tax=Kitasatospora purpeofusca TaxID=67352 RepID=UPI0036B54851